MGFRRRELHKRQVEQAGSAGGEAFDDDEPDWEGGRARERKGLKWNKTSKTGFDALAPAIALGMLLLVLALLVLHSNKII